MDTRTINRYLEAGKVGRMARDLAISMAEPGVSLLEIARKVEGLILNNGAKPAFPLNISVNNEAAHYTPSHNDKRVLRTGDVVKMDIGAHVDGCISDTAATVEVGGRGLYSDLIESTREALDRAISLVRPMQLIRNIGREIGTTIESYGYHPVKNLGGHGLDLFDLHSSIFIPNYDDGNSRPLSPGIAIAIEPFASTGVGMVHSGQMGNIYIMNGTKPPENDEVYRRFKTLPFAERWVYDILEKPEVYLKTMFRRRLISQFPVLREHRGTMIAQSEHTLLVLSDRVIVTTK